jgi:hypothetical protein
MTAAAREWLRSFWTAPVTPYPLAWFRIGLAGVLLVQALLLLGHVAELFGRQGIVDWTVMWERAVPGVPNLRSLELVLSHVGVPAAFGVRLTYALYVAGLFGLLVGYRTRWAAALSWLGHTLLISANPMSCYGVDVFAQIGLFYCVCFPVGQALSFDQAAAVSLGDAGHTFGAWFGLRILQLHVCIIYTASGVEKATGDRWRSGEAIWRAIMGAPAGSPIDCSFLADVPWLCKGLCWMTLLLEAGIVAFVWHSRLRRFWLWGIVGMHLGIALVLGLWTFSATMIVFDVAAFGLSAQPGWQIARPRGSRRLWAQGAIAMRDCDEDAGSDIGAVTGVAS